MSRLHSYGKVYNIGHAAVKELFNGFVRIEEKLDGSQFSFGVREIDGRLAPVARSREAEIDVTAPPKMFRPAVEAVLAAFEAKKLVPGWTYRGEAFLKPKHNTLAYDRVPMGHVMIFDIDMGLEHYMLDWLERAKHVNELGFETVRTLWQGDGSFMNADRLKVFLNEDSVLGGQKIEGVVVKGIERFCADGKLLMGKFVSEAYKEIHQGDWKARHPSQTDVVMKLVAELRTPARWEKAVQHLRDRGTLQNAPQDIGPLMGEVAKDVLEECGDEIKDRMFKWAWKQIGQQITRGLPQWYKERLLEAQFEAAKETKDEQPSA